MKRTFFRHFCAGEDVDGIRPTIAFLEHNGIGSILDFAAEADLDSRRTRSVEEEAEHNLQMVRLTRDLPCWRLVIIPVAAPFLPPHPPEARVRSLDILWTLCAQILRNIEVAQEVGTGAFAAVKLTCLGDPMIIEKMSCKLREVCNSTDTFVWCRSDGCMGCSRGDGALWDVGADTPAS